MRRIPRVLFCTIVSALIVMTGACDAVDDIRLRMRGATAREDYMYALGSAGLLETALARDWLAAADNALRQPLQTDVPVEETGYLDPAEPHAVALRVRLQRGQLVTVRADLRPAPDALLFIDVLRVDSAESSAPRHIVAADSGARSLEFEPQRTADYIIRLQPELLRGGRYVLTVHTAPALSFPVEDVGTRAIGSQFGAPRDGGARDHHGIDIFAPRGTPVVAAAPGIITGVRETPRGGKVVWLRNERRGLSLYYAHLDAQLVANGTRVEIGDTLGTVGNTGNAASTPAHLHFGIYRRGEGPLDPLPFVREWTQTVPPLRVDTTLLGAWGRTTAAVAMDGGAVALGTPLRIHGATGTRYRAELPNGRVFWMSASSVEPLRKPVAVLRSAAACIVRDRPAPNSAVITQVTASQRLDVLGQYDRYRLVRTDSTRGWTDCV